MAATLATAASTAVVLRELRRREILAYPNERSSHRVPTPTCGGLGVVPVVLAAWFGIAVGGGALPGTAVVLASAAVLAFVSWLADRRALGVLPRFGCQAVAVAAGLALLPADAAVFQGWLPVAADRLASGLLWLWFLNLFNFMDGIDGISGAELIGVGVGVAVVVLLAGDGGAPLALQALVLAGAGLGFLVWNWHPARVFLGDVGSIPLGYLTGWLLIGAAVRGLWLPALILPLYYLADAGLTLVARAWRGERVWEPHCAHFYQKAVRRGLSHAQVVRRVLLANGALIAAAVASLAVGALALVPAVLTVGLLLVRLLRGTGAPGVGRRSSAARTGGTAADASAPILVPPEFGTGPEGEAEGSPVDPSSRDRRAPWL